MSQVLDLERRNRVIYLFVNQAKMKGNAKLPDLLIMKKKKKKKMNY